MFISQKVDSWVVVMPNRLSHNVIEFVSTLKMAAYKMELRLPNPSYRELPDDRIPTYVKALHNAVLSCNPKLILVVLPNNRLERYRCVQDTKYMSSLLCGSPSPQHGMSSDCSWRRQPTVGGPPAGGLGKVPATLLLMNTIINLWVP